jgi:predicted Zn finger-like uncharacterized protein
MTDTVPITCPECAKHFQVPEDILGRKIRCKNCGKAFVAKRAEDVNLPAKKTEGATIPLMDDDDEDGDGKPYEVTSINLAPRCPSCANELQNEDDKVCLHCGFNLITRMPSQKRRVKDVTGGDIFIWLLPGILAAVGFFICLALFVLELVLRLTMIIIAVTIYTPTPPLSQMEMNCFNCFTLWTCLTMIFLMYHQGKFAIKRLIYNNRPPEVEL